MKKKSSLTGQAPLETKGQPLKRKVSLTGQAILELAVLGTLILFAFSMLLVYGQRFDSRQQLKMAAFRKAMQMAYYKNSAVSYTKKQDTRFTNLFSGYGHGQDAATLATATVMWQKGMPGKQDSDDEQSFSYYELNGKVIELPRREKDVITVTGAEQTIKTPVGIWKEEIAKDSNYDSSIEKEEGDFLGAGNQGIRNRRQSDLQDSLTTTLYKRFDTAKYDARDKPDEQPLPSYDYNCAECGTETSTQGAYLSDENRIAYSEANVGTTISKKRTWRTND